MQSLLPTKILSLKNDQLYFLVSAMTIWAGHNGFNELFALPINERSMKLLQREGFHRDEAAGAVNGFGKWKRQP